MAGIQTQQDLQNAILLLEQQQLVEKNAVQKHFEELHASLQPLNLLKNTISEINDAKALKKDMLKAAIALTIGYISKKIIEVYIKRRTPLVSAVETMIQIIISAWSAKNGDTLRNIVLLFFRTILQYKQKQVALASAD